MNARQDGRCSHLISGLTVALFDMYRITLVNNNRFDFIPLKIAHLVVIMTGTLLHISCCYDYF